jgi:hypothetical protein
MADPQLKDLLAGSSFAFTGTVQAVGETPVAGVEADDRTALVRVEAELRAPPDVDLDPGSSVTVQLSPDLPALAAGDRATFFASPLVYGDTLAVTEVARTAADQPAPGARTAGADAARAAVTDALGELHQDAVLDHARSADAVVRAHVVSLQAADLTDTLHEHEPQWWVATLDVDLVAAGTVPGLDAEAGGEVRVLYANSLDVRWRRWPKPKAGQGGMWILHRRTQDQPDVAPFVLCHPEDLQPSLQLDALAEGGGG